jgi:hypothetical protein
MLPRPENPCLRIAGAGGCKYKDLRGFVQKLSIKSDHSAGENGEKIKKFLLHYHHTLTSFNHRKKRPNFVSKVTIGVIIEALLFGRGPKRSKFEYRVSKYEIGNSKPARMAGPDQALRRLD